MKYYIVDVNHHTGSVGESQKVVSKYPINYYDNFEDFKNACIDKGIELPEDDMIWKT